MTTWAIIPVKSYGRAKSRLNTLTRESRSQFARALLERTMSAASESMGVESILLATDCADIARDATASGHHVQRDLPEELLGSVLDRALAYASGAGATRAVILMSDLPLVGPDDIDELVSELDVAAAAIAPDRLDAGTNALALRLPASVQTCFGNADSFSRHLHVLRGHYESLAIVRNPGLAFDVDVPSDLDDVSPDLLPTQYS